MLHLLAAIHARGEALFFVLFLKIIVHICVCVCLYEGWKCGEGRGEGFLPRAIKLKQESRKGWNPVRKIVKEKYTYFVLKKRFAWLPFIEVS